MTHFIQNNLYVFTFQFPDVGVPQWCSTNNEGTLHCSVSDGETRYCTRSGTKAVSHHTLDMKDDAASCSLDLKLNFWKYPAIHTNYITPQSTTL